MHEFNCILPACACKCLRADLRPHESVAANFALRDRLHGFGEFALHLCAPDMGVN